MLLSLSITYGNPDAQLELEQNAPAPSDPAADFSVADPQLRSLVSRLLERNPSIHSAHAAWLAEAESVPQTRALPDPSFSYRYFVETPETLVGPQLQAFELSQEFPWRGKRPLERDRAQAMTDRAAWQTRDLKHRLVAQLKRAYFEAAYVQEALAIVADEHELLRRFESIALKRYATGEGIQQSVVKVQTQLSRNEARRTELTQSLEAARLRIGELIGGGEPPQLEQIVLELGDKPTLDGDEMVSALDRHPRLLAIDRSIEADRLWAEREKLDRLPDFRLALGYTDVGKRDDPAGVQNPPPNNGQDIVALTVGLNIPLHRKRQRAGVAQATERVRSLEGLRDASENRLRFEAREASLRAESSWERARLYRDVIIPQAEESLASAEAAYSTNRLGFLDLLDAEQVLFEARLVYHRLNSDAWIALADLELALGEPYPGIVGGNDE